jgi:hypothetical protein
MQIVIRIRVKRQSRVCPSYMLFTNSEDTGGVAAGLPQPNTVVSRSRRTARGGTRPWVGCGHRVPALGGDAHREPDSRDGRGVVRSLTRVWRPDDSARVRGGPGLDPRRAAERTGFPAPPARDPLNRQWHLLVGDTSSLASAAGRTRRRNRDRSDRRRASPSRRRSCGVPPRRDRPVQATWDVYNCHP